jgi:hypothetical protein
MKEAGADDVMIDEKTHRKTVETVDRAWKPREFYASRRTVPGFRDKDAMEDERQTKYGVDDWRIVPEDAQ